MRKKQRSKNFSCQNIGEKNKQRSEHSSCQNIGEKNIQGRKHSSFQNIGGKKNKQGKCNICHNSGWDCRRVIEHGTLDFCVILSQLLILSAKQRVLSIRDEKASI